MLTLTEGTNIAVHALGYLAATQGESVTAAQIALDLGVSRDHLSKVLQRLTKLRLVRSQRGPKGGFCLARPPEEIHLLEIVQSIEGPWRSPHCVFGGNICGGHCALHTITTEVHEQVCQKLATTSLAQLPSLIAKLAANER